MRRGLRAFIKALWFAGIVAVALGIVGVAGVLLFFPRTRPASEMAVARAPEQIERGRYLVEHVAYCLDCHSRRDWDLYSGAVMPWKRYAGMTDEDLGDLYEYLYSLDPVEP